MEKDATPMQPTPNSAAPLDRSLRRVHRSVLATLLVCGVAAFLSGPSGPRAGGSAAAETPGGYTLGAVGLAMGSILCRRSALLPAASLRAFTYRNLVSLVLAGCIGLVGVGLAVAGGARQSALLFVVAGLLLALRPPGPVPAPVRTEKADR